MCGTVDSFQSGEALIGQTVLKLASEPEPLNWLTFPVLAHSESENTDHTRDPLLQRLLEIKCIMVTIIVQSVRLPILLGDPFLASI